jgi:sugar/nucleoside kinase (ribokinase family)
MDVACAGILVADVFFEPIDSLPNAGELKTTGGYVMGAGGCAANVAQCLRKLGRTVAICGKTGSDQFGDYVIEELSRRGVETSAVRRSTTSPTSSTVIINVSGEDRRYLHCIGANRELSSQDIDPHLLDSVRVLYVGGYIAMPSFSPADLVLLLKEARRRGVVTVLDVVIPAGTTDAAARVIPVLPWVDYFLPNEDEARVLTGEHRPDEQARRLAEISRGGTCAVTCGANGCVAYHANDVLHMPPFPVDSVDESGAGDAFTAGFITGLLGNWALAESLRLASAVGASCTRALGCTEGVFGFDEAVQFLSGRHGRASA